MPYIDIHTHDTAVYDDVIKVVNIFPREKGRFGDDRGLICSSGIHPWYIEDVDIEQSLVKMQDWLKKGYVKCVGEAGLDAVRGPEMEIQKEVFVKQVELAETYRCPLIIHCVKAYNEIIMVRRSTKAKQPWILHGFNSSVQMMTQMTDHGIFISLGPSLLRSGKSQDVCRKVPEEFLLFETDVSGEDIKSIYTKAAEIRDVSIDELKHVVYSNFKRVFQKK